MKVNLCLILAGLVLLVLGVYRSCPLRLGTGFYWSNGPIAVLGLAAVMMVSYLGRFEEGLKGTLMVTSQFLPMMTLLFPLMGFGAVVANQYQSQLTSLMAGRLGYPGTLVAAFSIPGSNSVAKFVETMWQTPSLRPKILYFLTATPLVSLNIFFIRQVGFGREIASSMYKTNILVAIGLLPVFWLAGKFFGF